MKPESIVNTPAGRVTMEKIEFDAKAFIFDKDGTLLSHDHFKPIMQKRVELLSEHYSLSEAEQDTIIQLMGLDPATLKIIPQGTMYIARTDTELLVETFLSNKGLRGSSVKSEVSRIFKNADDQIELEKYIQPLPGVPELLAALKRFDAFIAIATHDRTEAAKRQLTIANLEQYLDLIIGLDYDVNILHKPSPSMLLTACNEFALEPHETVVVGDSKNDVLMGKAGGAGLSIAVLGGEHALGDFKVFDAIIESVADLEILE